MNEKIELLEKATYDCVDAFCNSLKEKLLAAQKKYGYSDKWKYDNWENECLSCI